MLESGTGLKNHYYSIFACLFAIALQIQITIFSTPDYIGLRVNLADLALPFLGLFILTTLIKKKTSWPVWQKPFGYWAPLLLTIVIILALANGYRLQGTWNQWAIINKGVGWGVLMAYFAAAGWLATNRPYQEIRASFIAPFIVFLCLSSLTEIITIILIQHQFIDTFTVLDALKTNTMSGFMGNRNAFALLYLSILTISSIFLIKGLRLTKVENFCFKFLWFLAPIFFILNSSRSILLVIVPLLIFLAIVNWRYFFKNILPFILIGILITPLANSKTAFDAMKNMSQTYEKSTDLITKEASFEKLESDIYIGDRVRINVLTEGFQLYKHNPFSGIGIGSAYVHQQKHNDTKAIFVIDSTPLWILLEMGPLGLLSFTIVFIAIVRALYRKYKNNIEYDGILAYGTLIMLIGFCMFSLFHEVLYSRFLWVFLGFALAKSSSKSVSVN